MPDVRATLALLGCLGLLACAPRATDPPSAAAASPDAGKPNASEGIHYHAAGGGAVMRCNTWGFETICKSSGSR